MTDKATSLILAAQDGDPAAFDAFVRLTQLDVTRYCTYLGDPHTVDDLVQDTCLRALRSLHTFRNESPATRWLITIARRACADAIGHRQRGERPELTRKAHHDTTGAVELTMLVNALPIDQRQAFVLTQLLGYTYEEAADFCGCPVGTVRSRVARARSRLVADLDASEIAS